MKLNEIQAKDNVEKIILVRKRLKMKQKEFSKLIGYTPVHLANVENYKTPLSSKMVWAVEQVIANYTDQLDNSGAVNNE